MLLLNKTNFCTFWGSVKSQVLLLFDFFDRGKTRGGTPDKNFCDETKILSGIWIGSRDGITGDRPEMADFNCINNLKRW